MVVIVALALVLQQEDVWCLASNSDTSFAPRASILVGLGGLEKAFLAKDTDGTELRPVVRAVDAGLFVFLLPDELSAEVLHGLVHGPSSRSQRASQSPRLRFHRCTRRSCFTRSYVEVSASLGSCERLPRRSFHADDCDDIIARAIIAVGALAATIVGTVQVFHAYTCDDPLWNLFPGAWFSEVASASCLIERNRTPLFG